MIMIPRRGALFYHLPSSALNFDLDIWTYQEICTFFSFGYMYNLSLSIFYDFFDMNASSVYILCKYVHFESPVRLIPSTVMLGLVQNRHRQGRGSWMHDPENESVRPLPRHGRAALTGSEH